MRIKLTITLTVLLTLCFMVTSCGTVNPDSIDIPTYKSGQPLPLGEAFGPAQSADYDQPPIFLSGEMPIYPISKLLSGKSGAAIIEFTVGEDGNTHDLKVVDTSGEVYSRHAMIAIKEWRFKPAVKNAKPVSVRVKRTMLFTVR